MINGLLVNNKWPRKKSVKKFAPNDLTQQNKNFKIKKKYDVLKSINYELTIPISHIKNQIS